MIVLFIYLAGCILTGYAAFYVVQEYRDMHAVACWLLFVFGWPIWFLGWIGWLLVGKGQNDV